jgi:hypothetical protein
MVELSFDLDITSNGNVINKENKFHSYERGKSHALEEGMSITMW